MIGGYQILDLRGIDLQISASASNITDPYVLKQLLQLRDHIDKAYNFNKPLVNQLKPVLIRFRDKKNGEKTEGATFGEMSVVGNYYTFKITGRISGQFTLIINVAFHEVTNAYGNKEWLINTAKIQLADASDVLEGDIAIDGDLTVSGNAVLSEINGEENPSVKPIYCHPIFFDFVGAEGSAFEGRRYHGTCLIFNNSETPFTLTSFINYVVDLCNEYNAKIMLTGMCFYDDVSIVNTCIKNVQTNQPGIYGLKVGSADEDYVSLATIGDSEAGTTSFSDGVNKIN